MDDYDEIVSMLATIKDNQRALAYIKSFLITVMKRYK